MTNSPELKLTSTMGKIRHTQKKCSCLLIIDHCMSTVSTYLTEVGTGFGQKHDTKQSRLLNALVCFMLIYSAAAISVSTWLWATYIIKVFCLDAGLKKMNYYYLDRAPFARSIFAPGILPHKDWLDKYNSSTRQMFSMAFLSQFPSLQTSPQVPTIMLLLILDYGGRTVA